MQKRPLLKFPLTIGKYSLFNDYIIDLACRNTSSIVCVANVHMFIEAHKNQNYLQIINDAEIVTPDGKPLTWALRFLYKIRQDRVAGMDLLPDLLQLMAVQNISAYFYGGSQYMLDKTREFLNNSYPTLKVAGLYSPPFNNLGDIDNHTEEEIIQRINESFPSVVFVILGCPKQEKWMAKMKNRINTVMIGVGGALPVMIGIKKRAPKWMQNSGLEWLYRLIQEPRRLMKRYTTTNLIFIWLIFKEFIRIKLLVPLKLSKAS